MSGLFVLLSSAAALRYWSTPTNLIFAHNPLSWPQRASSLKAGTAAGRTCGELLYSEEHNDKVCNCGSGNATGEQTQKERCAARLRLADTPFTPFIFSLCKSAGDEWVGRREPTTDRNRLAVEVAGIIAREKQRNLLRKCVRKRLRSAAMTRAGTPAANHARSKAESLSHTVHC